MWFETDEEADSMLAVTAGNTGCLQSNLKRKLILKSKKIDYRFILLLVELFINLECCFGVYLPTISLHRRKPASYSLTTGFTKIAKVADAINVDIQCCHYSSLSGPDERFLLHSDTGSKQLLHEAGP